MDVLNPYLSALETIRFTAACRLPGDIDREAVVQDVVRLMSLEEWTDMVVGREAEGEGLPKHVRKRLTIALQLVCLPKILFLDEPTTGLGTVDANLVIQAIRRCTDHMGLITVATIHQPSKVIWDSFDSLLLLVKGGNLAYMGPMGENSETVLEYFFKLSGKQAPSHVNPADYVLSAVGNVPVERAVIAFQESSIFEDLAKGIESDGEGGAESYKVSVAKIRLEATKGKSAFKEIGLLTKRHLFTQWRNPSYSLMRLIASIFVSLYMGILFMSDKSEITGAVFSIGAIFFLVFVLVIPMQASVVPCIEDRVSERAFCPRLASKRSTKGFVALVVRGFIRLFTVIPFSLSFTNRPCCIGRLPLDSTLAFRTVSGSF
jgi:ABC-type multidrug transport system ATPase subunit